jgi:hypothetical protein
VTAVETSPPLRGPLRKRESSLWAREANDWYVEPEWVSERLFHVETFHGTICDPACGSGNIVAAARRSGHTAYGSDVVRRSELCGAVLDWLAPSEDDKFWGHDNVVSNPPFKLCDDRKTGTHPFVDRCLSRARHKVALLLPSNWIQGDARSRWLEKSGLRCVYFLSPRPSMPPGQVIEAGLKPGNGTTDYAWFVWLRGYDGAPEIRWLRRTA